MRNWSAITIGVALALAFALFQECAPSPANAARFTLPFNDVTVTTANVGSGMNLTMPGSGHAAYKVTFSQNASLALQPGNWSGQTLTVLVCQDATGGWIPTFVRSGGVNLHWVAPSWVKTASKCEIIGFLYTDPLNIWMTGYVLPES